MKISKDTKKFFYTIAIILSFIKIILPLNTFAAEGDLEPQIKETYPSWNEGTVWYDEKTLKHDSNDDFVQDHFFIKAVFYDEDQELEINELSTLNNIRINPDGTQSNFFDHSFISKLENIEDNSERNQKIDNLLFTKDGDTSTLYIPVKPLLSGTKYNVSIPPGLIYFPEDIQGNSTKTWSFMTSTQPIVSDVMIASISENYDEDAPIYIYGDYFYEDNVSVYIGGERAEAVHVREMEMLEEGRRIIKQYLEIYLPTGSYRLEPGIHNIEVRNDTNHITEVLGGLSIVVGGEYAPSEEYIIKKDLREGEIRGDSFLSEDTLTLNNRYRNYNYLKVDLDELMGEDVLVKKIEYSGREDNYIGVLEAKSIWSNISLFNLTTEDGDKNDISLRLGRVEPNIVSMLKNKLWDIKPKSEFIQATGENYSFTKAVLAIPYKNSNGKNIKALRYDEGTRKFYSEKFSVDLVEKVVRVESNYKGIFVIVED